MPTSAPSATPVPAPQPEHPKADLFGNWSGRGTIRVTGAAEQALGSFDLSIKHRSGNVELWMSWTYAGTYGQKEAQLRLVGNELRDYWGDKVGQLGPQGMNFRIDDLEFKLNWKSSSLKEAKLEIQVTQSGRKSSLNVDASQYSNPPPPSLKGDLE